VIVEVFDADEALVIAHTMHPELPRPRVALPCREYVTLRNPIGGGLHCADEFSL
jgi:hypothetical protein